MEIKYQEHQLKKENTKFQITDKNLKLLIGVGIVLIMILTPFLFYLYKIIPASVKTWETPFFTIETNGFNSVQIFIHALFTKLTFVISFSVWFLTCKYWWRWVLLVPLTMFLFQLTGVVNQNISYIDEYDFWYSLPVTIPVIISLVYIRNKMKFYSTGLDLKEQIDQEINSLKKDEKELII